VQSIYSEIDDVVNVYEDAKYDAKKKDGEVVAEQVYREERNFLIEKQRDCRYN
jgi:hypothetical protein